VSVGSVRHFDYNMGKSKQEKKTPMVQPPLNRVLRSQLEVALVSDADISNLPEESRIILELILGKLEEQKSEILAKLDDKEVIIEELKKDNLALKHRVSSLEEQVEDLAVSSRRNDLLVSGDKVPLFAPGESCSRIVTDVFRSELGYSLASSNIDSAYRIGRPPRQGVDRRNILVKLYDHSIKVDLLQSCKRVKPKGLFIKESLTPLRAHILYALRIAKSKFPSKVDGYGSREGRVYVWMKAVTSGSRNQRKYLNSKAQLEDWSQNFLDIQLDDLSA